MTALELRFSIAWATFTHTPGATCRWTITVRPANDLPARTCVAIRLPVRREIVIAGATPTRSRALACSEVHCAWYDVCTRGATRRVQTPFEPVRTSASVTGVECPNVQALMRTVWPASPFQSRPRSIVEWP